MNEFEKATKTIIVSKLKEALNRDIQRLVNNCLTETIREVEKRLRFVIQPAGQNTFRMLAKWDDVDKDGHET